MAALRRGRSVRAYPALAEVEKRNKSFVFNFAKQHFMRVVDQGDQCGLCGLREATPAKLPTVALDISHHAL